MTASAVARDTPQIPLDEVADPVTPSVETPSLPSLSPSRAGDFKACPLRYRLRVIDRLPEPPSPAAVRGTLVHAVLEGLFDLDAAARTLAAAQAMLPGAWAVLLTDEPELAALFEGAEEGAEAAWLASAESLLASYFDLEDPTRLAPAAREEYVETVLDDRLVLRGIIDRLDAAPDGALRVVDYKTGSSPGEMWEAKALFQLKFYALVLWRTRGVVPAVLQLLYLADRKKLTYSPSEPELRAVERQLMALGDAVARARESGDFQPSKGPLCGWCDFKPLCPAHGGTPPPYPLHTVGESPTVEVVAAHRGVSP
jgi:putative RecB family exonuclease